MKKFIASVLCALSVPLISYAHGPSKEIFDKYVVETNVELLNVPERIQYPLVRISWIISYDGNKIRYGTVLIPVWYTVSSMVHEDFSDYLHQYEKFPLEQMP